MSKVFTEISKIVKNHKIKYAFGIPGGGKSLELIDALSQQGIKFITTHHEASAAIMAGTIGKISNSFGLCISIKGPGLTNMLPGISLCHFENFPIISICESYDDNIIYSSKHKGLNHAKLTNEISKENIFLNNNDKNFSKAIEISKKNIKGPVIFNLADGKNYSPMKDTNIFDDRIDFQKIKKYKKPLIILGSTKIDKNITEKIKELKIPIFTTLAAKGSIDEKSDYIAGIYTGVGKKISPEFSLIENSDLIIGINLKNNELLSTLPFNSKSISINTYNNEKVNGFDTHKFVELDELENFLFFLQSYEWGKDKIKRSKKILLDYLLIDKKFLPSNIFASISDYFQRNLRFVLDTGFFCTVAEHIVLSKRKDLFLCAANSRYMGTSIPMGISAALSDKKTPTVIIFGDGGVGMYISEIKIAVERELPIIFILISDKGFGSILKRANSAGLNDESLKIKSPSFFKVFKSFGSKCAKVKNNDDLNNRLIKWDKKPLYLECFFDEKDYKNMVCDLRN